VSSWGALAVLHAAASSKVNARKETVGMKMLFFIPKPLFKFFASSTFYLTELFPVAETIVTDKHVLYV
jgi:hypothetical protein